MCFRFVLIREQGNKGIPQKRRTDRLSDGRDDLMSDPAFEGFGFGFTRAENKRVKAIFVYKREFGFASCSTII